MSDFKAIDMLNDEVIRLTRLKAGLTSERDRLREALEKVRARLDASNLDEWSIKALSDVVREALANKL